MTDKTAATALEKKPLKPHVPSPQAIKAINEHGQKWGIVLPKSMYVFIPDNKWIAKNALAAALEVKAHHTLGQIAFGTVMLLGSFAVAAVAAATGTLAVMYSGLMVAIGLSIAGSYKAINDYKTLQKDIAPKLQDNLKNRFMEYIVREAQKNRVRVVPEPVKEKAEAVKTSAKSAWGAISTAFKKGRQSAANDAPAKPNNVQSPSAQKNSTQK